MNSVRSTLMALLVGLAGMLASPKAVYADLLEILVSRTTGATELYLSARADVLFDLMGQSPTLLTGSADSVEFGGLSDGTFDAGDALLSGATVTIGGTDAGFEAMSLMVHPLEDKLPMQTPLDALTAIGVCNGPPAGTVVPTDQLHAYVGYFSDIDSRGAPLRLTLPDTVSRSVDVVVRDFSAAGFRETRQTLAPRETLTIEGRPATPGWGLFALAALLAVGGLAVITVLRRATFRRGPVHGT